MAQTGKKKKKMQCVWKDFVIFTSIVTDIDVRTTLFDRVIKVDVKDYTAKIYNNGHSSEALSFKNTARAESFDLSPYDETLVVDSDVIVCDSQLHNCFDQPNDLCMYRDAYDPCTNKKLQRV